MKRTSKAPVIIGVILCVISILVFLFTIGSYDKNTRIGGLIIALIFFIPSLILFISALITSNNAQDYNDEYSKKYENKRFVTTCFNCGHEVRVRVEQFSEHRNYPEGYVYCPICKKPLSKKLFEVVDEKEDVQKHKEEYSKQYKDKRYITTCFNCKREVKVRPEQFQPHRNYPEGYVYCPFCHKPLSINAFDIYDED